MGQMTTIKKQMKKIEVLYDNAKGKPLTRFRLQRTAGRLQTKLDMLKEQINSKAVNVASEGYGKYRSSHWSQLRGFLNAVTRRRKRNKIARRSRRINRLRTA